MRTVCCAAAGAVIAASDASAPASARPAIRAPVRPKIGVMVAMLGLPYRSAEFCFFVRAVSSAASEHDKGGSA
jgi:hypothetical protein